MVFWISISFHVYINDIMDVCKYTQKKPLDISVQKYKDYKMKQQNYQNLGLKPTKRELKMKLK